LYAEKHGYKIAYSNPAFEYWYLLHFEKRNGYLKDSATVIDILKNKGYLENYGKSVDVFEELQAKALKYEKALVLQTVLKDPIMDPVLFKQAKHAQNILTEQLARQMQEAGKEDILIMSAGPYKNCSCMSAYSVDAQKMADAVGMVCWADDSDVRFFTQILFHEDYSKPHK